MREKGNILKHIFVSFFMADLTGNSIFDFSVKHGFTSIARNALFYALVIMVFGFSVGYLRGRLRIANPNS